MEKFLKNFGVFYRNTCAIILAIMVLIVFSNAVLRYLFHSGFIATEEILRYLFIYLTFLGVVEVSYQRKHIAVSILTDALPKKIRTSIYILGYILSLYALYILFNGSIEYFKESDTSVGQVTGIPFQFIIASIIFAALGVIVFILRDLYLALKAFFITNEEFPPKYIDEELKEILKKNTQAEKEGE